MSLPANLGDRRLVTSYVSSELEARRLLITAKPPEREPGVPSTTAALRAVNRTLEAALETAMLASYDTIACELDGTTYFVKRQPKRVARPVSAEAVARAFDGITAGAVRAKRKEAPTIGPIDTIVACMVDEMNFDTDLWTTCARMVLDTAKVRTKKVAAMPGSDGKVRIMPATAEVVELAKRQLHLKGARTDAVAASRESRQRAQQLRKSSAAYADDLMRVVAVEEQRGRPVVHEDASGTRAKLSVAERQVPAKSITVPMLAKGGLLKKVATASIDTSVYGYDPVRFITPEVRDALVSAFRAFEFEHKKANATVVRSLKVRALPGRKAGATAAPVTGKAHSAGGSGVRGKRARVTP